METLEGTGGDDGGSPGPDGSGGGVPDVVLGQLGEPCSAGTECELGHCVDGVCCESACAQLCATCAAPGLEGSCSPAPSDVQCETGSCPAATECRGRDQTALALNCSGIGACRADIVCAALDTPAGESCQGGTGTCDGAGACDVPGKASLGEACTEDAECAEGHCVAGADGVAICCDAACDGPCQQCGASGHCDEAPVTDERCEPVTCPADNPCRDYPETITEALCRGFGQCRTAQSCEPRELQTAANCDCDAAGHCTLRAGVACTNDTECTSQTCIANAAGGTTCCSEPCGPGLGCRSDGQGCVECLEGAIECDASRELRCESGRNISQNCANGCTPGSGCNALAPLGFSCAAVACAEGGVCQPDVGGVQRCCSRDCAAEGKECAVDGSCVCPPGQTGSGDECLLQQGDPCSAGGTACAGGLTCVDGVCCDSACNGACESCNLPGSVGQCSYNSNDRAACPSGEQCVARNDCRGGLRQACAGAQDCALGNCEPLPGSSGSICCEDSCSGQTGFCSSDGTRCVQCQTNADCGNGCNTTTGLCNPLRLPGDTCNRAAECSTNNCIPDATNAQVNRCCSNCAAGQLCTAQGTCQDRPLGAGDTCQSDTQCGAGLFCRDGRCCTSRCDGACQTCSASGTCNLTPATDVQLCGPVTCAQQSTECRIVTPPAAGACSALGSCATSAQCGVTIRTNQPCTGGTCNSAGECVPNKVPNGGACLINSECAQNNCERSGDPGTSSSQGICCSQNCADNQFCRTVSLGVHECIECINDNDPQCPNGCNEQTGACNPALPDRSPCTSTAQCLPGHECAPHYPDLDDDSFALAGAVPQGSFCITPGSASTAAATKVTDLTPRAPIDRLNRDCCDQNSNVRPNQRDFFPTAAPSAGCPGIGFDYDCDTVPEPSQGIFPGCADAVPPPPNDVLSNCSGGTGYASGSQGVPCGGEVGVLFCTPTGPMRTCQENGTGGIKTCH